MVLYYSTRAVYIHHQIPSGHDWFRQWLVTCLVSNHYLYQCWLHVNWTLWNKLCRNVSCECIVVSILFYSSDTVECNYNGFQYNMIQSSAVITRSKRVRSCVINCRKWGRISIRSWIHKTHPIPRPNGWAMGCLLWIFVRKLTALLQHHPVFAYSSDKGKT